MIRSDEVRHISNNNQRREYQFTTYALLNIKQMFTDRLVIREHATFPGTWRKG